MTSATSAALAAATGYVVGSIPWGLLLSRWSGRPDPRTVGSGNIGATNVTRSGGLWLGAATLALDALKAAGPALAFGAPSTPAGSVAALGAVVGHCFPVWLRFRGGKGVACLAGAVLAIAWPLGPLAFAAAWGGVLFATRVVSLASLAASWSAPVAAALSGRTTAAAALAMAALVVTLRHAPNLARLRDGTEPRIGRRDADGEAR